LITMKNFILTGMLALLCAVLIPPCQPDEPAPKINSYFSHKSIAGRERINFKNLISHIIIILVRQS
ncbi:MAG: hypothetical protein WBA74_07985, partial [Cyclobacteriaceae bacterium]